MFKKNNFLQASVKKSTWLFAFVCVLTLGASACDINLPANSLTPTPTTLMGYIAPQGQSDGVSTEVSTPSTDSGGSGDSGPGDLVDICSLVSQAEAEAVLGQGVVDITPGVDPDNNPGGTIYFCTYLGSGLAVVLSEVDLGSAEAAQQEMQGQLTQMVSDDPSTTTSSIAGLGDQATWAVAEHAVSVTVVQGGVVFSIAVGGNIGDPAAYKTALQDLAASVAGRL